MGRLVSLTFLLSQHHFSEFKGSDKYPGHHSHVSIASIVPILAASTYLRAVSDNPYCSLSKYLSINARVRQVPLTLHYAVNFN